MGVSGISTNPTGCGPATGWIKPTPGPLSAHLVPRVLRDSRMHPRRRARGSVRETSSAFDRSSVWFSAKPALGAKYNGASSPKLAGEPRVACAEDPHSTASSSEVAAGCFVRETPPRVRSCRGRRTQIGVLARDMPNTRFLVRPNASTPGSPSTTQLASASFQRRRLREKPAMVPRMPASSRGCRRPDRPAGCRPRREGERAFTHRFNSPGLLQHGEPAEPEIGEAGHN